MLNAILNEILKLFFIMIGFIANLIISPIMLLLSALFPTFDQSFITSFYSFVDNYIFDGISFAREVFFNVTGYPRLLFNALVTLFIARVTFYFYSIPIKFVLNIWRLLKGSHSSSSS